MKRAFVYDCKHEGATLVFVATFSDVRKARLCLVCVQAINNNADDPRGVDYTVSSACLFRDIKV